MFGVVEGSSAINLQPVVNCFEYCICYERGAPDEKDLWLARSPVMYQYHARTHTNTTSHRIHHNLTSAASRTVICYHLFDEVTGNLLSLIHI